MPDGYCVSKFDSLRMGCSRMNATVSKDGILYLVTALNYSVYDAAHFSSLQEASLYCNFAGLGNVPLKITDLCMEHKA